MEIVNRSSIENEIPDLLSDTSVWSLVPHKVSEHSAEIWTGTLFPYLRKPALSRIIVYINNTEISRVDITLDQWQRPFRRVSKRFYVLLTLDNLLPNQEYKVVFFQQLEGDALAYAGDWLLVKTAYFSTLPLALPTSEINAFTVSLSSCFYEHKDYGQTAQAFKTLYANNDKVFKPDIKFMVGDQVYLDIGADSLSPLTNEVRLRIADDYAKHWQALGSMLSRGGTWMLPDDHEYWNDYPFYDGIVPTLYMLRIPKIRAAWKGASEDGVKRIQQTRALVETFSIGNDLSFCIADLRSSRSKTQFINKAGFAELIEWITTLTTPGVLVIPQVLVTQENKLERNLLSFKKQYTALLNALATASHDIVVLSGDVHFGRICSVDIGTQGVKLIEVVASPTSNLTGVNSVASSKPSYCPEKFPDPKAKLDVNWPESNVNYYDEPYQLTTTKGRWFSSYWRDRTNEHMMTIGFNKIDGKVHMTVQAWLIRKTDADGKPKSQFKAPFTIALN